MNNIKQIIKNLNCRKLKDKKTYYIIISTSLIVTLLIIIFWPHNPPKITLNQLSKITKPGYYQYAFESKEGKLLTMNIYIEDTKKEEVTFTLGNKGKHELLTSIVEKQEKDNGQQQVIAAANCGLFNVCAPKIEHQGVLIVNHKDLAKKQIRVGKNKYTDAPVNKTPKFGAYGKPVIVHYKSGSTKMITFKDKEQYNYYLKNHDIDWMVSTGNALVNTVKDKSGKYITSANYNYVNVGEVSAKSARTMFGVLKNNSIIIVTVDKADNGNDLNSGIRLNTAAHIMRKLNCKYAIQFDGDGSTEFMYKGSIKNDPSDGREREIGSAVIIQTKKQTPQNSNR